VSLNLLFSILSYQCEKNRAKYARSLISSHMVWARVFSVLNRRFSYSHQLGATAGAPRASSDKQKSAGSRWHASTETLRMRQSICPFDAQSFT
ncbi:hypothetical protein, partial [Sporolactobacillus terrae]|uniref:hypothetical protein n=1 Tax=Sporolactobacillus terrae TaxID=269673 RepID=UPI001C3F36A5